MIIRLIILLWPISSVSDYTFNKTNNSKNIIIHYNFWTVYPTVKYSLGDFFSKTPGDKS